MQAPWENNDADRRITRICSLTNKIRYQTALGDLTDIDPIVYKTVLGG
jgi:hypothetical protein